DVAQVRQAEEGLAVGGLEDGHASQGDLERGRDLTLHFLGGGAGPLGDDLDDGGGRVGVGLDVDTAEGVVAVNGQGQRHQQDNQPAAQGPGNDLAYHGNSS